VRIRGSPCRTAHPQSLALAGQILLGGVRGAVHQGLCYAEGGHNTLTTKEGCLGIADNAEGRCDERGGRERNTGGQKDAKRPERLAGAARATQDQHIHTQSCKQDAREVHVEWVDNLSNNKKHGGVEEDVVRVGRGERGSLKARHNGILTAVGWI